jgi:hypothetical protein
MVQTLVVALVVIACALKAAWMLSPAAARRAIARRLLALPLRLPTRLATRLRKDAEASGSGCACDGCDHAKVKVKAPVTATQPLAAGTAPITFHRRLPR